MRHVVTRRSRGEPCTVLQVRELSVEAGARMVEHEASFTAMPRDEVGLFGRNDSSSRDAVATALAEWNEAIILVSLA